MCFFYLFFLFLTTHTLVKIVNHIVFTTITLIMRKAIKEEGDVNFWERRKRERTINMRDHKLYNYSSFVQVCTFLANIDSMASLLHIYNRLLIHFPEGGGGLQWSILLLLQAELSILCSLVLSTSLSYDFHFVWFLERFYPSVIACERREVVVRFHSH